MDTLRDDTHLDQDVPRHDDCAFFPASGDWFDDGLLDLEADATHATWELREVTRIVDGIAYMAFDSASCLVFSLEFLGAINVAIVDIIVHYPDRPVEETNSEDPDTIDELIAAFNEEWNSKGDSPMYYDESSMVILSQPTPTKSASLPQEINQEDSDAGIQSDSSI